MRKIYCIYNHKWKDIKTFYNDLNLSILFNLGAFVKIEDLIFITYAKRKIYKLKNE